MAVKCQPSLLVRICVCAILIWRIARMYLRRTTVNKDGKTHSYWRLVRSVRRGRKVVQETVAHPGELMRRAPPRLDGWRLRSPGASSTPCSRQARRPVSRARVAWDRVELDGRGAFAVYGLAL